MAAKKKLKKIKAQMATKYQVPTVWHQREDVSANGDGQHRWKRVVAFEMAVFADEMDVTHVTVTHALIIEEVVRQDGRRVQGAAGEVGGGQPDNR